MIQPGPPQTRASVATASMATAVILQSRISDPLLNRGRREIATAIRAG